jgi:pimeloyl-ACP methyl ester carboxylesterase
MSEEARDRFNELAEHDWSDRSEAIDYVVGIERACAGRSAHFDEAAMRVLAARIVDRTVNVESSMKNHVVMDSGGDRWRDRLGEVRAPTLVIHGTEDPVLPYGNALALVKEIPEARLLTLRQTGHELPRAVWDKCDSRHLGAHGPADNRITGSTVRCRIARIAPPNIVHSLM